MLASPLLVGVLAGGPAWVHLPLAAFWFAGYFAFFATSLWLKARRRARWFPPVRAYAALSAVLGVVVVVLQPGLARWAPLFALPLGIGLYAAAHRQDRALVAGLATTAGSALMTVVAYDAGPGTDLGRAWQLALVQFLYFAGTVFYVKTVIRERDNVAFRWLSAGFHVLALLTVAVVLGLAAAGRLRAPPRTRDRRAAVPAEPEAGRNWRDRRDRGGRGDLVAGVTLATRT
jgi:hypothetical protein